MADKPYAYQRWACSECEGEPIDERTETYDLRCETCGHAFLQGGGGLATYVPDPEDEFDDETGGEGRTQ
jgi:DNA-directed RNA polymerase subunit RPC12/RpoP